MDLSTFQKSGFKDLDTFRSSDWLGTATNRFGFPHLTLMSKCGEVFPRILGQGS